MALTAKLSPYNLSTSPNLVQMKAMLEQAFTANHYENTILHSDQGWQYQHDFYHHFLEDKGINHLCHVREIAQITV